MADPITISDLKITGRVNIMAPVTQPASATHNADFGGAADVTLEFRTVNQNGVFGIARTLFIDNGSNPSEVEVSVSGTDQFFTVPSFAEGYFHLECAENSDIRFVTDGGASDRVTITIFNWEVPPSVWYSFGAFNIDVPIMAQGSQPTGTDMDAPTTYNRPLLMGGVTAAGILTRLLTDAAGALLTGGGAVFGPDAGGAAPTHPPVYIGVRDSAGNIIGLQLNAAGDLQVADTLALAQLTLIAASASVLDDWDSNDRAKISPIAGQDGVSANAGVIDATTQRVVIGSPVVSDYSIVNMTGASQDVVLAGNGHSLIFIQTLATNVGSVWLNLSGGVAVVGAGVELIPGGSTSIQPGIRNKITGIAATANDDLTVYAG